MLSKRAEKAIDIFLDAISEGKLAKGTCAACAVGNLVADAINYKITSLNNNPQPNTKWSNLFCTDGSNWQRGISWICSKEEIEESRKLIGKTDFTEEELKKIEYTFETNTKIRWNYYDRYSKEEVRRDQLNGLNKVIELMLTFDENKEDKVEEIFTKRAQLIPV